MTTTAASSTGDIIAHGCDFAREYAEKLVADVPADRFAECPTPTMNNPAWVYGHLVLYPNRVANLLGVSDFVTLPGTYDELFAPGSVCQNDPALYPRKDELMCLFTEAHAKAADAVRAADGAEFEQVMPIERWRERFPRKGIAIGFLLGGHMMLHLGQISSWRRAAGFDSIM